MKAAILSAPFARRILLSALAWGVWGCATATPAGSPPRSVAAPVSAASAVPSGAMATGSANEEIAPDATPASVRDSASPTSNAEPVAGTSESDNDQAADPSESWLGVSMKQLPEGVVVNGVLRGSPASSAGLLKGDRLVRVGSKAVSTPTEVAEVVRSHAVGARLDLHVQRADETRMLYAVTVAKPNREDMIRDALVGYQAPSISDLRTVQGSVVPSWNQLRGQVVVLEFWASWCVACRALAPTLNDWHDELGPSGVQILGITMDPYEEAERASRSLKFATFTDEPGDVTLNYQGTALPTLVVVDRHGTVRDVMVGLDFERLPAIKQTIVELASAQATPLR